MYCVYLTTYSGNRLPPFYIGSTSLSNIKEGYRGSVKSVEYSDLWKSEPSHLFKTFIVSVHETRQEAYDKEEKLQRKLNVVLSSMYVNLTYANGGFSFEGKTHTIETRIKMSKANLGIPKSVEHKSKISSSHLGIGHTEETRRTLSKVDKSYTKTNEYRNNMAISVSAEKNGMFGRKHSEESKAKMRATRKARTAS